MSKKARAAADTGDEDHDVMVCKLCDRRSILPASLSHRSVVGTVWVQLMAILLASNVETDLKYVIVGGVVG